MKDLGYVYNRAAAALRSAGTLSIGVIASEIFNP
jgi:DNA-binding LacI/PurR family transcriptional regulator